MALALPSAWAAPADRPSPEDTGPDPDACSLLPLAAVGPVLIGETANVHSQSSHPAPGESTCDWSARGPTLTPDAPPESRLTLSWYHMGSLAKAHAQLVRIGGGETRTPLVKTADSDDEVARPRRETVVARHGRDIAVIDGQQVKNDVGEGADWSYQEARELQVILPRGQGEQLEAVLQLVVAADRDLGLLGPHSHDGMRSSLPRKRSMFRNSARLTWAPASTLCSSSMIRTRASTARIRSSA